MKRHKPVRLVREMEKEVAVAGSNKLTASPPSLEEGVADQNSNVPRLSRMQIDLLVNSFVNDMTRVATLGYTKSVGMARMNWLDVGEGHHFLCHEPTFGNPSFWKGGPLTLS